MDFSDALLHLKAGSKIRREGWNGKGIFVGMAEPGPSPDLFTARCLYIDTTGLRTKNKKAPKCRVPWLPSHTDILAEDWELLK